MPKYPYKQLGNELDRKYRNDLNQNFIDIESDLKDIADAPIKALEAAGEAEAQALYAQEMGDYADEKGLFASEQGAFAQSQGNLIDDFKMIGEYAPGNTYKARNIVTYLNKTYIAKQNVPMVTFPSNTTYWSLVAEKGDKGDQGIQGIQGVKGDKGDKGDRGIDGLGTIVSNTPPTNKSSMWIDTSK
ncbi:MAG: hypothetical protein ACQET8_22715 [Bacillota bacterium]